MVITLKDIAKETHLSVSTVSRILNNRHSKSRHASKDTHERVLKLAKDYGYVPHAGARAMVKGKSDNVGLFVPSLDFGRYVTLTAKLIEKLSLRPIVLATHWSSRTEATLLEIVSGRIVDAIIDFHYQKENLSLYRKFQEQGCHLIFRTVEEPVEEVDFDCVGVDVEEGVEKIIEHLYEQGYRKIGFVGGVAANDISQNRFERGQARAYLEAHKKLGLTIEPLRAIPCEPNDLSARDAVIKALSERRDLFDALIVHATNKVLGVLKAIEKVGLTIPRDIGVATIGDTEFCDVMEITMWTQPVEKICKGLVSLLKKRVNQPDAPVYKMSYESSLIVRNSTKRK